MRHLLSYICILSLAISFSACQDKGKPGPCTVTASITAPGLSKASFRTSSGEVLLPETKLENGTFSFERNDEENMPYIGILFLSNPDDSLDFVELPIAIEKGEVEVEVSNVVYVKGTPTNKRLQQFMTERNKLKQKLQEGIGVDVTVDEIRSAFSDFYSEQIVRNVDNPLGQFVYEAYGRFLSDEARNKAKVLLEKK